MSTLDFHLPGSLPAPHRASPPMMSDESLCLARLLGGPSRELNPVAFGLLLVTLVGPGGFEPPSHRVRAEYVSR